MFLFSQRKVHVINLLMGGIKADVDKQGNICQTAEMR